MAHTRRVLFEGILSELGEKIVLRASSIGTSTTFIDNENCLFPDNSLRGREVWYAESNHADSADNKWTKRTVTGNSQSNTRITVSPAWDDEPQIGDVVILANDRGYSVRIDEIHDKIDALVRRLSEELATETVSAEVTFSARTGTVAIPSGHTWLLGAQWEDRLGRWHTIPPKDWDVYENRWGGSPTLAINGVSAGLAHTRPVRLILADELEVPENDDAELDVDYAWFTKQAAYELRQDTATRWGDVTTGLTMAQLKKAEADPLLQRVGKRFSPVGKRVRLAP